MTQTMRRPLGSASDQVRAEPSASLRLLPSTATGCTRTDARRTRHFCVRVLEAGRSSVCSEARSLCPLVVSWAAPGERQTDCACADCSSCRGAPGCASAKRWRWPKATSIRHAERSCAPRQGRQAPRSGNGPMGLGADADLAGLPADGASRSTVLRHLRPNVRAACGWGTRAQQVRSLPITARSPRCWDRYLVKVSQSSCAGARLHPRRRSRR
jgi:hypothetical protein